MSTSENTPPAVPQKRWSCLAKLAVIVLAFLLLLLGWLGLSVMMVPPLIISKETTYVTGPLTADGQIDYFKALEERTYPPEMKTDDNGYRIFVR